MAGETNLNKILSSLSPKMIEGDYVFLTFTDGKYGDHAELEPVASILESEGLTLVVSKTKADQQQLKYGSVFKCITLQVHSSLDSVGLTAAFSQKLTEHGISVNVLAGYFHDHIFVQSDNARKAISALQELSS